MQNPTQAKYERARRLIDALAASGNCADYIDVQTAAKGRGLDQAIEHLLAKKSLRDEIDLICRKARAKFYLASSKIP